MSLYRIAFAAVAVGGLLMASCAGFWSRFRAAALAKDAEKVAGMTRFPFWTKGMLDDAPKRSHEAAASLRLFPALLEQDSGLRPETEPMWRYIERTPTAIAEGNTARMGAFAFEKVQES